MVLSSPNRDRKLSFPVASFWGCSGGPAAEKPVGSSGLLSATSSAGFLSFYIPYVHCFLSCVVDKKDVSPPTPQLHYYQITQQSTVVAGNDKCNFATSAL